MINTRIHKKKLIAKNVNLKISNYRIINLSYSAKRDYKRDYKNDYKGDYKRLCFNAFTLFIKGETTYIFQGH